MAQKQSKYAGRKLRHSKPAKNAAGKAGRPAGIRFDPNSPDYTGGGRPPGPRPGPHPNPGRGGGPDRGPKPPPGYAGRLPPDLGAPGRPRPIGGPIIVTDPGLGGTRAQVAGLYNRMVGPFEDRLAGLAGRPFTRSSPPVPPGLRRGNGVPSYGPPPYSRGKDYNTPDRKKR